MRPGCPEDGNAAFLLKLRKKFSETIKYLEKANPAVRRGRKAKGLLEIAGLPGRWRPNFVVRGTTVAL